jgi:hypothetical protein
MASNDAQEIPSTDLAQASALVVNGRPTGQSLVHLMTEIVPARVLTKCFGVMRADATLAQRRRGLIRGDATSNDEDGDEARSECGGQDKGWPLYWLML